MGAGASGNNHHVGFVNGPQKRTGRSKTSNNGDTRVENEAPSHGNVTPGSQLCTVADEQSIHLSEDSNAICSLTPTQQRNIRLCLSNLEEGLNIAIRLEKILAHVQLLPFKKGEHVLTCDEDAKGICVVDEGVLEVMSPRGEVVLNRLLPGDFCGELSTVFGFPCTATVQSEHRATVLCIPRDCVQENLGQVPSKEEMLQWCARRSYVDTGLFDSGILSCKAIESCLKASFLSVLSAEALQYLATLVVPVIFSAGDTLYRCEDEPDYIYCILRGAVECSGAQKPTVAKSIKNSTEGYVTGREGFFAGVKRGHSVRSLGPLLVAPIGYDALYQVILKHPTESSKLQALHDAVT